MRTLFLLVFISLFCVSAQAADPRPFTLRTADLWDGDSEIVLSFQKPVEFDGLTKSEVMLLRQKAVEQNSALIDGVYQYSEDVFGGIVDGKPWWGIMGQYCYGPGSQSPEGPSEESRFVLNPFLLLMVDGISAFVNPHPYCIPSQPFPPKSAVWYPRRAELVITYDLSHYFSECQAVHGSSCKDVLRIDAINARDFGFSYLHYIEEGSIGVGPSNKQSAFHQVYRVGDLIHLGQSCGFAGGCNNGSPDQLFMDVKVNFLPAQFTVFLWREQPQGPDQRPDVRVRFIFN